MFVYLITNTVNGKKYVGKTVNSVEQRWRQHVNLAKNSGEYLLCKALRKYGPENFTVEPIARFDSEETLSVAENLFIAELDTRLPNGYNMTDGGEGVSGLVMPEEARAKMRAAKLGTKRIFTPEHRAKLSAALKGRKPSPQCLAARPTSPSPETREKLRQANIGKSKSPETIEKQRIASSLAWQNSELRTQQSLRHKGKKHTFGKKLPAWTEERRAKVKATWAAKGQANDNGHIGTTPQG